MPDSDGRALAFTKMQGTGNDFLVVDNRAYGLSDDALSDLAARWCPRRFGVGADGLLALAPATQPATDYRMRYFNADGSRATMCGNGARCLARFAFRRGIRKPVLRFESDAGTHRARLLDGPADPVRLYLGPADDPELDRQPVGGRPGGLDAVHYAWTGTGHWVARVDDLDGTPVEAWGAELRNDAAVAPEGANANFAAVDGESLRVRTFEKGVEAETLSCGTGALAAAVVAWAAEWTRADPVTITTRGGALRVGREGEGGEGEGREGEGREEENLGEDGLEEGSGESLQGGLYLEGPAGVVYRGRIDDGLAGGGA